MIQHPLEGPEGHTLSRANECRRLQQQARSSSPPIPAFFHQPQTIENLVNATVGRMLARIGIENELFQTWGD